MEIITQIVSNLQSVKEEISRNVTDAIGRISLPKEETSVLLFEPSGSKPNIIVLVAGLALFIIGLISKGAASAICIILGLGGVAYYLICLYSGNKKNITEPSIKKTIDYTNESQRIFNILKDVHLRAAEQWDNAVMEQASLMKAHIDISNQESQKKIRAYDVLAKRSTVSFPMMDVLQKLMSCQSTSDYKQYLDSFNRVYIQALNKAFKEESVKYQEIKQILLNS